MKKLLAIFLFPLVAFGQGTPTLRFNTVAEMVAKPIPTVNNSLTALVAGRVTANDGGGGVFFFTPASVTATNLGTVFPSTGVSGRWFREYSQSDGVNVKWFGAVGDGSNDDTTAFQAALTIAGQTYASVFVPASTNYVVKQTLTVPSRVSVKGESRGSRIVFQPAADNDHLFLITNSDSSSLEWLNLDCWSTTKGHIAIFSDGSGGTVSKLGLRNLFIQNFQRNGLLANITLYLDIRDCQFSGISNAIGFNGGDGSYAAIAIKTTTTCQPALVSNCRFSNNDKDVEWLNASVVTLEDCAFENTGSLGNNVSGAILFTNSASVQIIGIYLEGARTVSTNGALQFNSCRGVSVIGGNIAASLGGIRYTTNAISQIFTNLGLCIIGLQVAELPTASSNTGLMVHSDLTSGVVKLRSSIYYDGASAFDDYATISPRITGTIVEYNNDTLQNLNKTLNLAINSDATTPAMRLIRGGQTFSIHGDNSRLTFRDQTGNADLMWLAGNSLTLPFAGMGFSIKEGSNARMGRTALVNGTATVSNTSVTSSTEIFLTRRIQAGTTVGTLSVGTVSAGASFVINSLDLAGSLSADDDSTVNWLLVEPSP